MKNKIILLAVAATGFIVSCSGDQTAKNPPDTVTHQSTEQPEKVDTSQVTTTKGSASNVDNSGSGGTNIDTPKKKAQGKKQ